MLNRTSQLHRVSGRIALLLSILTSTGIYVHAEDALALSEFAARGNVNEVRRLLDAGVSVDTKQSNSGSTPLTMAIRAGKRDVINLLLERGANPNAKGPLGYTPLMAAAQNSDLVTLRALLIRGADPDAVTSKGLTALMIASADKSRPDGAPVDLKCVQLLLRAGADPDKKHESGATALTLAQARGARDIVQFLVRVGTARTVPNGVLGDGTITGSVVYRERLAVSPTTFAVIRLLDMSSKTPVVLTSSIVPFAGKQVPISFRLPYDRVDFTKRSTAKLAVDARLISNGTVLFLTPQALPVLQKKGDDKKKVIVVAPATPEIKERLAAEALKFTDKALTQFGQTFSGRATLENLTTRYSASFLMGQLVRISATSVQVDYGNREDRFYYLEGRDAENYPPLRASFLTARRLARSLPPIGGGPTYVIPGQYEDVAQKIILGDDGKALITEKTVDKNKSVVSDPDIKAARNFSRLLSAIVLRNLSGKKKP